MAEIDGGALSFKSVMDNDQLNAAIEETVRRVQGFSNAVVGAGDTMDSTTQEMVECIEIQKNVIQSLEAKVSELDARINSVEPGDAQNILIEQANAARQELEEERQGLVALEKQLNTLRQANAGAAMSFEQVRATLEQIGAACEVHENALASLEAEYDRLGSEANKAFMSGRDEDYNALKQQQTAIQGEIRVRKSLLNELRDQSNALEEVATKIEKERANVEKTANAHTSLRQKIREVKEEMANLRANGIDENSAAYKNLVNELGRLQDIQGDIQAQGSIMANDENQFAGLLSGLQGVVGGFTAAQGAVALFGAENEELQQVMLKVQSLMSITMGLQQVAQTLNKDSAFSLVTLSKAKEWWNHLLDVGRGKQIADTAAKQADTAAQGVNTAATKANSAAKTTQTTTTKAGTAAQKVGTAAKQADTAAQGVNTAAAKAGTVANIGLAGAFRMVGAALKSIPVFGWIAASIGVLIGVISHFVSKTNEAEKAQEEFSQSIVENAYKPIGKIEELSDAWTALGDNIEAKKQFIRDNKKAFDELGVSIKGVTDAENLLIRQKDAFINAQIEKAKSLVYIELAMQKQKKAIEKREESKNVSLNWFENIFSYGGAGAKMKSDKQISLENEAIAFEEETKMYFEKAREARTKESKIYANAGIEANNVVIGSLEDLNQRIATKREELTKTTNNAAYKKVMGEIEKLQKQADKITGTRRTTGGGGGSGSGANTKDPFLEKLAKYKSEYTRFMKWINSGDEILVKSANQEFEKLLKEGKTYIDYLKNQRDELLKVSQNNRNATQNKQLRQLNDAIAEETKNTVLESFNNELSGQLTNAKSVIDMLNVIEKKRKELSGDGTELDNAKKETLDNAEKDAQTKLKEESQALLEEYATYEEKKQRIAEEYAKKRQLAERQGFENVIPQLDKAEQRDLLQLAFDDLKMSPDYIRAFEDLEFTSDETLNALITRFESVKDSIGKNLNPEDVKEYINAIQSMVDELNSRDPFGALKRGYQEVKATGTELKNAQADLNRIREQGGAGTDAEVKAVERVNKAKDNFNKKNKEVRKSEKEVERQVQDLCSSLSDLGKAIGGEAGQIISIIGDIGGFVTNTIDSVKVVAATGAQAISTVEKASIILAVISAAYQIATKIINMFAGDDGTAAYEAAKKVYESYVDTLHDVIDAELELLDTMSGKDAQEKVETAIRLTQKQIDKARELGKQYLDAGASSGFLGIGSSSSNGVDQRENISGEAWKEAEAFARAYNVDWSKISEGRMTGLFDLTIEQLAALKREAPLFFAQLHEDTRKNINDLIEAGEQIKSIEEQYNESLTGLSFESMKDDFVSALQDMELDAKKISDNIQDYMRKALINDMFKKQYQGQLEKYYEAFANAMKPDSDGGALITDNERAALDAMRNAIVRGATYATEQINNQFKELFAEDEGETSLAGAVKGVTEQTADIIAGQMNAIRINQLESTNILRQSLQQLNMIASNTIYNRNLAKIDRIISLLESSDNALRSQGLS